MMRIILLLAIAFGFGIGTSYAAVDSMYANTQLAVGVEHPEFALGAPDGQEAHLNATGELWLRFDHDGIPNDIAPGATIHIYWSKQSTDSVAAVVALVHVTPTWLETKHDSMMIIDQPGMITLTVPNAGYNAIYFKSTSHPPATGGSTSFFVDAVSVIQENLGVALPNPSIHLAVYPNPSLVRSGFTVHVPDEFVGTAAVHVYDMLGHEVFVGHADEQTLRVQLDQPGTYMARMFIDGLPRGEAIKVSVQ